MSDYPTDKDESVGLLQQGTLELFSGRNSFFGGTEGGLCSVNDVTTGNGTFYPFAVSDRLSWVQYWREVKEMSWTVSWDFDDGAGRTETASESGTTLLAPRFYSYDSGDVPDPPGIESRRLATLGIEGLTLKETDGVLTIEDAVTRTDPLNPTLTLDLRIRFVLFSNVFGTAPRFQVANDPSSGMFYPRFFLRIEVGKLGLFTKDVRSYEALANNAGSVSVEDWGSCPLYSNYAGLTCNFTANIASRF